MWPHPRLNRPPCTGCRRGLDSECDAAGGVRPRFTGPQGCLHGGSRAAQEQQQQQQQEQG
eukprot:3670384-Alexandrium_andersonii.AAC.1